MEREIARVIARRLAERMAPSDWSLDELQELQERLSQGLAEVIKERLGKPILPKRGESLAVSVLTPKTAALAFDRVYRIPIIAPEPVPEKVGFYCATPPEMGLWAAGLATLAAEEVGIEIVRRDIGEKSAAEEEEKSLRFLVSQFSKDLGVAPTLFYHAAASCQREFPGVVGCSLRRSHKSQWLTKSNSPGSKHSSFERIWTFGTSTEGLSAGSTTS